MSEISYKPLVDKMVWSYSRLNTFEACPYAFFLRYIEKRKQADTFFASYGSFLHTLMARFYTGELEREKLPTEFLLNYSKEVRGIRPAETTVAKYVEDGTRYLKTFEPLPYNIVGIEKQVRFEVEGYPFIGFIDYLGEQDGKLFIVDHKTKAMKPRTKRKKPTKTDTELDAMFRQLYLYSVAVKEEYGEYPAELCFNSFRSGIVIKENFDVQKLNETIQWAVNTIREIEQSEFFPNEDYFYCRYLCDVSEHCDARDI